MVPTTLLLLALFLDAAATDGGQWKDIITSQKYVTNQKFVKKQSATEKRTKTQTVKDEAPFLSHYFIIF